MVKPTAMMTIEKARSRKYLKKAEALEAEYGTLAGVHSQTGWKFPYQKTLKANKSTGGVPYVYSLKVGLTLTS